MRICNISQIYINKDDPWSVILAAASFSILSTTNRQKCYSPAQLIFGRDKILLIEHTVGWELIRQRNQAKMIKDNIHKNRHRVDHKYKVGDNVILTDPLH